MQLKLITWNEFADVLSVSRRSLYDYEKNDPDFPPRIQLGKQFRFKSSDVEAYIEKLGSNSQKTEAVNDG